MSRLRTLTHWLKHSHLGNVVAASAVLAIIMACVIPISHAVHSAKPKANPVSASVKINAQTVVTTAEDPARPAAPPTQPTVVAPPAPPAPKPPVVTPPPPIRVVASIGLISHTGPGVSYPNAGALAYDQVVTITCQAHNRTPGSPYLIWDRLTDGTWVTDWYVSTPNHDIFSPGHPECPAVADPPVQAVKPQAASPSQIKLTSYTKPAVAAPAAPSGSVVGLITYWSHYYGANLATMLRVGRCESGYDPNAVNPHYWAGGSNPGGVFQFLQATYASYARMAGIANTTNRMVASDNIQAAVYAWTHGGSSNWACQ